MEKAPPIDRVRQVCEVAIRLFLERGFDNTPMSLIAKEAGLTKAGIYHHFESKQELLHVVHKTLLQERMLPIIREAGAVADPEERLRVFVHKLCTLLTSDFAARILVNETHRLTPDQFQDIRGVWLEELSLVREAIAQLQREGRAKKDLHPTFAAFAGIGMCGWILYWFDSSRPESAPDVARTMASVFLDGILEKRA